MRGLKMAYSIDEAAESTGIGKNTLRKLIEWQKLPVLKVGWKLLIRSDTIETFMELNEGNDLRNQDEVKAVYHY
jgi:excisionase family DNA binding protein